MRKLALIMTAFGFVAFAGVARADNKTEDSVKTDSHTTLGGKRKTTTTKTVERADGSKVETETETTRPKADDRRNDVAERRDVDHDRAVDKRDVRDEHVRDERVRDERVRDDRDVKNVRADGTEEKVEHKTTLTGKKQTKKTVKSPDGTETETTTTVTKPDKK